MKTKNTRRKPQPLTRKEVELFATIPVEKLPSWLKRRSPSALHTVIGMERMYHAIY